MTPDLTHRIGALEARIENLEAMLQKQIDHDQDAHASISERVMSVAAKMERVESTQDRLSEAMDNFWREIWPQIVARLERLETIADGASRQLSLLTEKTWQIYALIGASGVGGGVAAEMISRLVEP